MGKWAARLLADTATPPDGRTVKCVFRTIVTDRSGIVTGDFGIVTGRSGIVTDEVWRG